MPKILNASQRRFIRSDVLCYDPCETPRPFVLALRTIAEDFPLRPDSKGRSRVRLRVNDCGPRFERCDGGFEVSGRNVTEVLRAMATLRGFLRSRNVPRVYEEKPRFDALGLMLDASRNGVPTVATVKFLLRRMALMGMNTLMLYTEDTYEVPSQPYIGYLRGRYTRAELREMDAYAATLGIEMFPCVQALAHLAKMLRWRAFADVCDTKDILLAGAPKTYRLLEQMLAAASAPYRSKRIHIGMDEAHDLGLGKYLQLHGNRPRFQIMNEHLRRVTAILRRLGLKPMIWSDMYFRLGSKSGDYYDPKTKIPSHVARDIPKATQLVYWDYYHAEKEFYLDWIDRHRALGKEPIFAAGLWTWNVFWANFSMIRLAADAGMLACKERRVREAFTTAWGDDGCEVDMTSILPGLQHFAEHGYTDRVLDPQLARQFFGSTGEDLKTWLSPVRLDETPFIEPMLDYYKKHRTPVTPYVKSIDPRHMANWMHANPSKYLLWQDPLLGLFDAQIRGIPLRKHYSRVARELRGFARRHCRDRLEMPLRLAEVLEDKAELGVRLLAAYRRNDRRALVRLSGQTIPRLIQRVWRLHKAHRNLWFRIYKPNGWEVLEARYGALATRLGAVRVRLDAYLNGKIDRIAELEERRLPIANWAGGTLGKCGMSYREIISPSY